MPTDPARPSSEPATQTVPGEYEELEASEWCLDWGDIVASSPR